jgi:hypothetical protein
MSELLELVDAFKACQKMMDDLAAKTGGGASVRWYYEGKAEAFGAAVKIVQSRLHEQEDTKKSVFDVDSNEHLRSATLGDLVKSREAAEQDGGIGMIDVDGRRCLVVE